MRQPFLAALAVCWLAFTSLAAQTTLPAHTVFLLGNTTEGDLPAARLHALRQALEQQKTPFTVVHLGDIVSNEGLAAKQDTLLSAREKSRADALIALVKGLPLGRIYFVPGDKDWANSGRTGLKAVRRLEKYIEQQLPGQNAFVPTNGCPGPEVVDVAPLVRLVALNTPWFTHPYDRPEAPDTDCKTLTKEEFREQLQDIIDDTRGRNLLLLGHQPVVTNGVYGGHEPLSRHLLPPVLGTVYAAYRQNVGTPRDLASPGYQQLRKELLTNILRTRPGVVYAAAHDYSLQLTPVEGSYHLVSGSFVRSQHVAVNGQSTFNEKAEGYAVLDYYADGTVKSRFFEFKAEGQLAAEAYAGTLFRSPCDEAAASAPGAAPVNSFVTACPGARQLAAGRAEAQAGGQPAAAPPTTTVVPGPEYAAGPARRFFIGPLYRSTWLQPIQVKTLDLRTERGGLQPFGRGGGRQTTSLKFLAADSTEYVFRSVDKDVTSILPPELQRSFATSILKDITTTANPYSALPISAMLDHTDILHARPRLFRLPDDKALGEFRADYAGLLGTLEDRPADPKPGVPGFGKSDEVTRTYGFFRKLYKDHDNRIDAPALARARAFDMLVADFGKHEDNWKWAGYDQGKHRGTVYRPIPRDRDQAFTLWNGALTYLANREWAVPSIEDFQAKFHDMESLNWPARHLDRSLLQGLSRQDWQAAAHYLQQQLTPAVIDEATATLPAEVQQTSGQAINRKLKARIQELPRAVDRYYRLLARQVDVVGSNKAEIFEVERLPGGRVRVREYDLKGDTGQAQGAALFDRTFEPRETKEISVYGLDGQDIFRVTGQGGRHSILVRVIGGAGKDSIRDDSRATGLRTLTKVYDTPGTALAAGPETNDRRSASRTVNLYDREAFEYDGYTPRFGLFYNRNDGFGASVGLDIVHQGFRKPDYKNRYGFDLQAATNGLFQVTANTRHRHAIGKTDLGAEASYGSSFPFYNFFGIGNNTSLSQDLYDDNYYRARYKGIYIKAFAERTFFQRSYFRLGPSYEYYTSSYDDNGLLGQELRRTLPGEVGRPNADFQRLAAVSAELDLDLRNRRVFAQRGVRLFARHDTYRQLTGTEEFFGFTYASAEYLGTARLGIPITLALKGGGGSTYGNSDHIPFYKLASLGLAENLRGYYRNRFTGDASVYVNSELRFALGQSRNHFLPFYYGLFGFYDQGRVYYQRASPGGWHAGYGGGFYLAPVVETLAFSISYQLSEENSLVQFGLGFRIDK